MLRWDGFGVMDLPLSSREARGCPHGSIPLPGWPRVSAGGTQR